MGTHILAWFVIFKQEEILLRFFSWYLEQILSSFCLGQILCLLLLLLGCLLFCCCCFAMMPAVSSCFKWLKYMAWSREKSDGRLSTGKECKRAIKWSKHGISQWGKEISRITVPQREEFYREQGNNVLGEGNVYNYKWLISMTIFNLINLINSKANFTSRMCFAVGNKTRFVMLGLKYYKPSVVGEALAAHVSLMGEMWDLMSRMWHWLLFTTRCFVHDPLSFLNPLPNDRWGDGVWVHTQQLLQLPQNCKGSFWSSEGLPWALA